MMVYRIFYDGAEINTIVAAEAFVVGYCERNGYTYEAVHQDAPAAEREINDIASDTDVLNVLLGVDE